MNYLKIALIGLGSIGKRHIKNIDCVLRKRQIDYSIDVIRHRDKPISDREIAAIVQNVIPMSGNIPDDYDVVFITNPTHLHLKTIRTFKDKARHMFIEKPVFDQTDIDVNKLSLSDNGVYYVACPLRYTAVIQYLKQHINPDDVYSVRAISSSYLPSWRPHIDYRHTYSAHRDQGGGVSIDLIHEWDYLIYLFGFPNRVFNIKGTYSNLEIDSDDVSIYIAKYTDMLAELHLDYFGRQTIRELLLFCKNDTIKADLVRHQITYLKSGQVIELDDSADKFYMNELSHFFDLVIDGGANDNDINHALRTLVITKGEL